MTYVLTTRERKLLDHLQLENDKFHVCGELVIGTGAITLKRLTELGLIEMGRGRWGDTGWRLTDDGWRCMYGLTEREMKAGEGPYHPLKVWSWPPTLNPLSTGSLPCVQLASLPPLLNDLKPLIPTLK